MAMATATATTATIAALLSVLLAVRVVVVASHRRRARSCSCACHHMLKCCVLHAQACRTRALCHSVCVRACARRRAAALSHTCLSRPSRAATHLISLLFFQDVLLGFWIDSMFFCNSACGVSRARRGGRRSSRLSPALAVHAARQQGMPHGMGETCGTPQSLFWSMFMVCAMLMY